MNTGDCDCEQDTFIICEGDRLDDFAVRSLEDFELQMEKFPTESRVGTASSISGIREWGCEDAFDSPCRSESSMRVVVSMLYLNGEVQLLRRRSRNDLLLSCEAPSL